MFLKQLSPFVLLYQCPYFWFCLGTVTRNLADHIHLTRLAVYSGPVRVTKAEVLKACCGRISEIFPASQGAYTNQFSNKFLLFVK